MKPKNFPGRKNIRRMNALDRMQRMSPCLDIQMKIDRTMQNIMNQDAAESIKTKKFRG